VAQTEKLTHKKVKDMAKHDAFQERTLETVDYIAHHKSDVMKYVIAGLAAVVLIGGFFWYRSYQHTVRQEKLQALLHIHGATINPGEAPPFAAKVFKTDAERDAAMRAEFPKFISEYSGSDEASVASYLLGINYVEGGNTAEGEKYLKMAIDQGSEAYTGLARIALAQVYYLQGKVDDAVKLIDPLIAKPTPLISKEHATIEKAKLLIKSNPAEARKLLEPLRTSRSAVSQSAIGLLSEIK
jgi:predicted negative regulator of RcsB-dependent stress response